MKKLKFEMECDDRPQSAPAGVASNAVLVSWLVVALLVIGFMGLHAVGLLQFGPPDVGARAGHARTRLEGEIQIGVRYQGSTP